MHHLSTSELCSILSAYIGVSRRFRNEIVERSARLESIATAGLIVAVMVRISAKPAVAKPALLTSASTLPTLTSTSAMARTTDATSPGDISMTCARPCHAAVSLTASASLNPAFPRRIRAVLPK